MLWIRIQVLNSGIMFFFTLLRVTNPDPIFEIVMIQIFFKMLDPDPNLLLLRIDSFFPYPSWIYLDIKILNSGTMFFLQLLILRIRIQIFGWVRSKAFLVSGSITVVVKNWQLHPAPYPRCILYRSIARSSMTGQRFFWT